MPKKPRLSDQPVFVNGRTSTKTYLVVATKADTATYNAVGVRKLSEDEFKFHFWPSDAAFGITLDSDVRYERGAGISAWSYTGAVLDKEKTIALIDQLRSLEGVNAAPRAHILEALMKGYVPGQAVSAEPEFAVTHGETMSFDDE
ncbi:hypothetical protein WK13_34995 [Burkholderia ubonensis]|nr:hypothetical protein WK13_34995 [Burkholderia ubonensis]